MQEPVRDDEVEAIDDQQIVRRQIFLPHMARDVGRVESVLGYPSQFVFQTRDGRRLESVVWAARCDEDETLALGLAKAESDRQRRRDERPDLADEELPSYVGFLGGCVGRIRGIPSNDDCYCTQGVFGVEHAPEKDVYAHAHVELLPDFLQALIAQIQKDGTPQGGGTLGEKNGRQHAINMLIRVFEVNGLHCAPGVLEHLASAPEGV